MKKYIKKLFIVSIICIMMPVLVLASSDFPIWPMSFYGSVSLDGTALPAGSYVYAYYGDNMVGQIELSEAGIYGYTESIKAKLVVGEYSGSKIVFKYSLSASSEIKASYIASEYSSAFQSGRAVLKNLVFSTEPVTGSSDSSSSSSGGFGGSGGVSVDRTAPAQPQNFSVQRINASQVKISWQNPTISDFKGVILVKNSINFSATLSGQDLKNFGTLVYEGTNVSFSDLYAEGNNYYYLSAFDQSGNYSSPLLLFVSTFSSEQSEKIVVKGAEYVYTEDLKSLYGLDGDIVNSLSLSEAQIIFNSNSFVELSETDKGIYARVAVATDLSDNNKYSIAYFIEIGSPTTRRLGAGERAGALNSFISAFGHSPLSESDWQDIVKIANGRWPASTSVTAEELAKQSFQKVYLREADMNNTHDNAAVTIMAYGLRPANRNMNSEAVAIKTFKVIFKIVPNSAIDWDIVRAIAYSGAVR